jgi:Type VI secretion system (T6SS), amidase immunity protein
MSTKLRLFVAIAFMVAPLAVDAKDANVRIEYSSMQYLKNFALSTCIADGYKSDEVVKDSLAAASGYLELGHLTVEAYEEAASLGKKYLAKDYQSKSGEKLILMKCIDFFHSKELQQIATKYSRK